VEPLWTTLLPASIDVDVLGELLRHGCGSLRFTTALPALLDRGCDPPNTLEARVNRERPAQNMHQKEFEREKHLFATCSSSFAARRRISVSGVGHRVDRVSVLQYLGDQNNVNEID
jgi:hypothetical protein